MARQKVKTLCSLSSWADVDGALRSTAECERAAANLQADMNAEIDAVKSRYADMARPVQQRMKHLQDDIHQFVAEHREELSGKTRALTFGQVGFRISTKVKYSRSAQEVIQALKAKGLSQCLKVTETVVKEQLRQLPVDLLETVGAYLHKEDEFWLETRQAALEESEG